MPDIHDWDKHHADLKWKKPESDGGAPIVGYVIEKKDQFRWVGGSVISAVLRLTSVTQDLLGKNSSRLNINLWQLINKLVMKLVV